MSQINHVVFDLGQVLIRWDPDIPYRRLIPDADARRRFFDEICTHDWNAEQDRGRGWREAEELLIARHPAKENLIRAYRRHWHEMIPGAIDENVALVAALIDRGVDVTALTNWAADTFEEAEKRFPILSRFRGATVSGRVGLIKPDPAIFDLHARTFGLAPAATLFFDDSLANVAAARSRGWQAEHYVSTDGLRAALRKDGLLP